MTNFGAALIVILVLGVFAVISIAEFAEFCRLLNGLRRDWRNRPDAVVGLIVIILMGILTSCAPLRERLFSGAFE